MNSVTASVTLFGSIIGNFLSGAAKISLMFAEEVKTEALKRQKKPVSRGRDGSDWFVDMSALFDS